MDVDRHVVTARSEQIQLPLKEFELLEVLLRNAGRVLTRMQLIDRVWGADYVGDTKTLDVHVKRLRAKIEQDPAGPRHTSSRSAVSATSSSQPDKPNGLATIRGRSPLTCAVLTGSVTATRMRRQLGVRPGRGDGRRVRRRRERRVVMRARQHGEGQRHDARPQEVQRDVDRLTTRQRMDEVVKHQLGCRADQVDGLLAAQEDPAGR